jgi:hypothetical protein
MRWSRRRCTEMDNDKRSAFPQPADNGMRPPGFFAPERACATEGIRCTGAGGAVRGACASSRHPTQAAAVRIFGRRFLLDGEPFVIRSGEMHPVRVPTRIGAAPHPDDQGDGSQHRLDVRAPARAGAGCKREHARLIGAVLKRVMAIGTGGADSSAVRSRDIRLRPGSPACLSFECRQSSAPS